MKLKTLVKWTIFISISVSEELELSGPICNKELLFWLFPDFFKSKITGIDESMVKTFGELWNMFLPKI
jgi:hypothetical protein